MRIIKEEYNQTIKFNDIYFFNQLQLKTIQQQCFIFGVKTYLKYISSGFLTMNKKYNQDDVPINDPYNT